MLPLTIEEKTQRIPFKLGDTVAIGSFYRDGKSLLRIGECFPRVFERRGNNLHRPEGKRISGLELALHPVDLLGIE